MRAAVSGESHSSPLHEQGDAGSGFPLSSAQRGMWFAQQLAPSVPVCIAQYVDLRGDLDVDVLRRASRVAGHEFQSGFLRLVEVDGEPIQIVDHSIDDTIALVDFRGETDPMASARRWIDENYTAPVDLTRDRLVAMSLLQVEEDRYLWYSKIHHVALDGYGAMTMVNRTAELYTAEVEGREPAPAKAADLRTLYEVDQAYRSSARFETDRQYWADHVRDVHDGATLANNPGATVAASKLESASLPDDVVAALENSDASKGATAAAVVIAAFACYLSRMTGRENVLVNMPVSARTTATLRRSGGMLVNVAPIAVTVPTHGTVGDLVAQVQLELMGALRHQRFSIEDIRRDLKSNGIDKTLVAPMVNVMLFHQQIHLGSIVGEFNIVTSGPVDDLLVNIYQSGHPAKTFVDFRGNPNRYVDEDLAQHHRSFVEVVAAFVAASPHDDIDDVHPESAAIGARRRVERQELLYWHSELADRPEPAGLPLSRPRTADATREPRTLSVQLGAESHRALLASAARQGSSVLVSLHTAVATVLARVSGESENDVSIGARTPYTAGNTVVLRSSVDPSESFSSLSQRLRGIDSAALAHSHVTFADVAREVATDDAALFRIVLAHSCTARLTDFDGVDLVVETTENVDALGAPAGISVDVQYDAAVLDEEVVRGHAERLLRILNVAAENSDAVVGDIDVLSESERAALVPVRGGSSVGERLLPEILCGAVDVAGVDAAALVSSDRTMSYGELDAASTRLARLLISRGVGPGSFVALALARSVESVVSVWAVAKAGAAFLPVDPSYPVDRIAHMLTDSGAAFGITIDAHRTTLTEVGPSVSWTILDDEQVVSALATHSDSPITDAERVHPLTLHDAAYLIYTSGSTGVPKGVVVTHRGLSDMAELERVRFEVSPRSRTLAFASTSFDASVLELLLAFSGAATMVIAPTDVYGGPELASLLLEQHVTHAFITPAALASVDPTGLDELRVVATGGEACGPELVERWAPGRQMFNAYGPTEATVFSSVSSALEPGKQVDIGSPITGSVQLVLDERLQPVPVGVAGELYLSGPALARGYHARAGLTSERFVAAPFGVGGERMYRTGDVVRWNASGALEYVGRSDFQVKVRGFRIELGEIDAVIASAADVEFVATLGVSGPAGSTALASYLVPIPGSTIDVESLRAQMVSALPSHMVPSAFVLLDSIPLTPAGKLDRRALPEPEFGRTTEFRAPVTDTQRRIADVFAELLDGRRVGIDDSFFDLGGNSLVATRVVARLNAELGTGLRVLDLFEAPTIEALSARAETSVGHDARPALVRMDRPDRVPLSQAQQRMWFINQFDTSSPAYNIPLAVRMKGAVDVSALETAVADVVARHESLRTVFPVADEIPHQNVLPVDSPEVVAAAGSLSVTDVDVAQVADRIASDAGLGFDVTTDVPFRARLYRVAVDEFVLAIVVHHIAADGASMAPLAADVMVAYSARVNGESPYWEPLPVQYADYTLWQRALLGDEDDPASVMSSQLAFWSRELADLPDLLPLPIDRPRPPQQSVLGATTEFEIPSDLRHALAQLASEHDATLFMVVHSALALLLSRLSGTDDIAIGTPIAGRGEAGLDKLVGMFVGTLVLRTEVSPHVSFTDLLARTRAADLAAFDNTDVPFEKLVDTVATTRSTDHSPLFQVLLEFQNNERAHLELPGLAVSFEEIPTGTTKFDLQLRVDEAPTETGASRANFTYSTELFDASTVDSFVDRFLRLLRSICEAPTASLHELEMLSAAERTTVLETWNATDHPLPAAVGDDPTLVSLFDLQVARSPYSIALVFDDEHVTYREFDDRSNQLARHLVSLGVGPETHVGLAVRRSTDLLVGMYAILKAGGAYVPIDPDHPVDRSAYVIDSADPICIVTTSRDWINVPVETPVLALDLIDVSDRDTAALTNRDRTADLTGANTAYVIYTSGSTGRPKGVAVTHGAIANRLLWMQNEYHLEPSDNVLQKTPATFDVSVWEFFWPLQVGAKLVIAEPDGHRDPGYLSRTISRERITTVHFVPSMLSVFTEGADADDCASLRLVFCSGEALPPATVAAFSQFASAELHNLYGPTEAAVDVTHYHCAADDLTVVPIGSPVWNTQVYVLDGSLKPAPVGSPGELYLAGVQLARGYVGRGDLTADRFVADPFGSSGSRLYRTGDLVRWRADGNLEYIGRTDFQVKLRGLRIELPEIEAALLRHDTVAQAVALVHSDAVTGEHLLAYVVPTRDTEFDASAVTAAVATSLPAYMVPSIVVELDAFPLNASGKLDRKLLPEPEFGTLDTDVVSPENPIEEFIAAEVADLLGVPMVGVTHNFFEAGGNSLVAMRLVARINASLGSNLTVRDLFDAPTVRGLAAVVESQEHRTEARPALVPMERGDTVPLSLAQQRMWFINQYDTSSSAYNVAFAMRMTGALDVDAVRAAVADVVERHESLRTVFPLTDDGPVQSILEAHQVLSDLEPVDAESEDDALRIVAEVTSEGFDVAAAVPVRAQLLRLGPDEHVLAFVVHHISSDGFSTAPLARDLIVAYSARVHGHAPNIEPLPVQYADYALWQRAFLGSEEDPESLMSTQLAFWVDTLSGAPEVLELPLDRPRPSDPSFRGAKLGFDLDAELHGRMASLASSRDSSVFMIVHAALGILLSALSGSEDISVGTPISGRGDAALDDVVGMFVNTLVLRTRIESSTSFQDLLDAVRSTDLEAFTHADVPFERVVDRLDPVRTPAYTPLFQVMLEFQHTARPNITLPNLDVEAMDLVDDIANFDLQLTISEAFDVSGQPAGITASFRYATDLFDEASVAEFATRYESVLRAVTADPAVAVGDIDMLTVAERTALAPVRGAAALPERLLPDILTDAVSAAGTDTAAIEFEDVVVSYGELDARSSQLARLLIDRGVGPDTFVALALPRSVDTIVAMWATAKAGAAFLPVDPTYPTDRIRHMLVDSAAPIGLTTPEHADALGELTSADDTHRTTWLVLGDDESTADVSARSTAPVVDADRTRPLRLDDAAYLIYTSGSTGVPKGVVVTHRGLANLAAEENRRFRVVPGSRTLAFASPSFDASILEFMLAFGSAATMVVAPPSLYGGPELSRLLDDKRVTHAFVTPAALASVDPTGLRHLDVIATGGDACSPELVERWAPGRSMFNAYGPTEGTIFSSISDELHPGMPVDIGAPTIGFAEVVLDRRMNPVPVGVPGELYLAGPALARGYHGRQVLTSERFVANPFATDGSRMYRTGDVVRWTRSGALEFVGRSDSQVKVRGFRIELGEIDSVLATHPTVDFVTTVGATGPAGNTILVAYVLPTDGASVDTRVLRDHVAESLPSHMIPAAFVELESIPLTPAGKLDRRALPAPTFDTRSESSREASTPVEKHLAELFAEVLRLDHVGIDESFFALGGDSIMSIQLVSRAKAAGIVLSPRDVFERKTVAALAEVALSGADEAVAVLEELPGGGVGDVPLTPIVSWMIERTPVFDRHTQTALLTLPRGIDRVTLEGTIQAIVDHHDMLRGRLREIDGAWTMDVQPVGSVTAADILHHADVESTTPAAELDRAAHLLDPAAGSMIRFVWLDSAEPRLLIVAHHLVVDGVSWRILVPDMGTAWSQIVAGETPTLLPVGTSMRRWAHGLVEVSVDRRCELDLWQHTLSGQDPLVGSRPLDSTVDVHDTVDKVEVELPTDVTDDLLTTIPEAFHGSVNDGLMAALALAVAAWRRDRGIETPDSLISLEGHGREDQVVPGADLARTVGWFTTIFPVRIAMTDIDIDDALDGGADAGRLIKAVKERLLAVPDHGIGYGMLRYLDEESAAALSSYAAPQISFNYLGRYSSAVPENLRDVGWLPVDSDEIGDVQNPELPVAAALDINAVTTTTHDGEARLKATFAFPTGVLERDDVDSLGALWVRALTAFAHHARRTGSGGFTPSDLDLVQLDQAAIDDVEARYPGAVDIWSMSPLQAGLLFHAELSDQSVDAYLVQLIMTLTGSVDEARFRAATRKLLDRHANLRTAFVHNIEGDSVQVVSGRVDVPWTSIDLTSLPDDERDAELDRLLAADRGRRFNMAEAPLLRFMLIAVTETEWRLVLTNHHILIDGWSTPLLVRELLTLYATDGDDSVLPRVPAYREYLTWMSRRNTEAARDAWRSALAGLSEPTLLTPVESRRQESTLAARKLTSLTTEDTERLRTFARVHGVTLNTLVQAAWGTVLASLTGRDDVLFGATVSGRPPEINDIESMVGLFINTLPVRVTIDPRESLGDFISRLQNEQASLLDHHYLGLTEIQRIVGPVVAFDSLTVFESYPMDRAGLTTETDIVGMRVANIVDGSDTAQYPMTLVAMVDDRLHIEAKYLPELFASSAVDAIVGRIGRVMHAFATTPDLLMGKLDLLSESERAALVPVRGGLPVTERLLPEILCGAVDVAGVDAAALVSSDRTMSYGELDAASTRLARLLISRGVGPGSFVALALSRSVESVVSVWAVAKAGAAFLPVDPSYPVDRIAHMLTDSGVGVGVTVSAHRSVLGDAATTVDWVFLDDNEIGATLAALPDTPVTDADRTCRLRPSHAAYLIYTSGSTGVPKGVVVTHTGLKNFAEEERRRFEVTADSRVLAFASPSFDASVLELLFAYGSGATLVVAPTDVYGGAELASFVAEHRVTHAFITPAALASVDPTGLDELRVVATGGEACGPELVERWAPGRKMFNAYGPTEATVVAVLSNEMHPGVPVEIGSPVLGSAVVVLDARLQPVPVGVAGELYLAGPGLARGYHDRAVLTSERFVAAPFGVPGERMYRTGDVVRWNDSGALEYVGRSDFQVKIRGFRIELGEIDAVIATVPGVEFVATLGVPGPAGSTVLVSYLMPVPGAVIDVDDVRVKAASALPSHMVPSAFVLLDAIPLTPAGKLDRRALPTPDLRSGGERREPVSDAEITVAQVFGEVLGIDDVGLDDNFFDLGGDSLSATRVTARVNSALGTNVSVRALFEAPTVEMLAARTGRLAAVDSRPALVPMTRPDRIPLSQAQQRMWFINQFDTSSPAYNIPLAVRLTGVVDVDALNAAIADVLVRHESLRTTFPSDGEAPRQSIHDARSKLVSLVPVDVEASTLFERIASDAGLGFDVTVDVPFRARLYRVAVDEFVLAIVVHHIAADGASMAPLAADVMVAYSARVNGESPYWEPLPVQYADYTLWQRALLGDEDDPASVMSSQLAFWSRELADLPDLLPLPTDRPRPAQQSMRGATVKFEFAPSVHRALIDIAREAHSTVFMAVHAAWALLMARLSGTEDIAVGTPIAGRGEAGLDKLVGMFVGTLVLRTEVSPHVSFTDLLARTRAADLAAFDNTDVPFERLVDELAPLRTTDRSPLFQVLIEFQNNERPHLELPELVVTALDFDAAVAKFDLQLTMSENVDESGAPAGMSAAITYATDLFDESTVRMFADRFSAIVEAVTADPNCIVGDVDIVSPAEVTAMQSTWNHAGRTPSEDTLTSRFETAAARFADTVAVVDGTSTYTYADLDARANRLARHLVSVGVGPETLVAVAMPRTADLVVVLLAVLKAGGGYLPVDVTYPADRLAFMLDDASPVCVVSTTADIGSVPTDGITSVLVDDPETASALERLSSDVLGDEDRLGKASADSIAYVIYTSGSTGRPKGVQVTHTTVATLFENTIDKFGFDDTDVWTMFHSYAFDFSVWELWGPLLYGGKLVIVDYYTARSPEKFRELLVSEQVTVLNQTPTAFYQFAEADRVAPAEAGRLALRYIVFGGEALDLAQLGRWYARHDENAPTLVNMYGITETTVHVSYLPLTADFAASASASVIGQALPGLTVSVRDHRLRLVPPGVTGEMYVSGAQLSRGYLGRTALTSTRFVADPESATGTRMYRTGDTARWNRDGSLEYLGRSDTQIQLHGFRIELGEIESALSNFDGVAQAVVTVRDDGAGDRLVGYVVPESGRTVEPSAVLEFVGATLTSYMVPAALLVIDELPLTANGKLDRRALPAPDFASRVTQSRAPATPIEERLASLFAEVLGLDAVGVDDSFFALGGDSIMSIQLVSRAKAAGLVIAPRDIFERKTVASLAEVAKFGSATDVVVLEELPGGGVGDLPLTPIVQWMLGRSEHFGRYTQTALLQLPPSIDSDVLDRTVQAVLDRHDMLRARLYRNEIGDWTETVAPAGTITAASVIHRVVVDTVVGDEFSAVAARELDAAADRLDPADGRMIQMVWFATESGAGRLLIVAHHLVIDGVSWRILVPDLATAWARIVAGENPDLAETGTSMRRWATGLAEVAERRVSELPLWTRILTGDDPLIGTRALDPAVDVDATVDRVKASLPVEVTEHLLTTLPEAFHGSVSDGLLTGLALALTAWRRERGADVDDALVSLEGHGREEGVVPGADLGRTIGWFTTIFPVRLDLAGIDVADAFVAGSSAGDAIKSIKEQLVGIPDHGIGFGLLRYLTDQGG
ncbi:non-ribosomal peptide synthase/polyketide synthase, partial [Rhodococcus sp. BP-154]